MEPIKEETAGGKRSRWMAHVKKTMRAHKGKSLKQVLKMAAKSYKGGAEEEKTEMMGGGLNPLPLNQSGARRRRSTRKSRKGKKGSRKH
jgi:hypothetical protein